MWLAALVIAGCWWCAVPAQATHIYFSDSGHIDRANLNGSRLDRHYIVPGRGIIPIGVAVAGRHIYWTAIALPPVGLGRANLNGTGVDAFFTPEPGDESPSRLAVAGGHIYWTNTGSGTIGRANIDGSGITENFIVGPSRSGPTSITVAGSYIYWTNQLNNTIGRAKLDGTGVNERFIVGAHVPDAVTVASGYIYWGNIPRSGRNTIGRAKLNGTAVEERFLTNTTALALTARGRYIYGSDFDHIWRAALDGRHVDRRLIPVIGDCEGIAIG